MNFTKNNPSFFKVLAGVPSDSANDTTAQFSEVVKASLTSAIIASSAKKVESELIAFAEGSDISVLKDLLPDGFEVQESNLILTDSDDRGFPDYDEIVEGAADNIGVSVEQVEDHYTRDMHDDVFSDGITLMKGDLNKSLSKTYGSWVPNIIVTGELLGSWGFPVDSMMFSLDYEKFIEFIESDTLGEFLNKVWGDPESYSEIFSWDGDDFEFMPTEVGVLLDLFLEEELLGSQPNSNALFKAGVFKLDEDYEDMLDDFKTSLITDLENLERPEKWANNIESHEWYNKSPAQNDLDEDIFEEIEE